MKKNTSKTVSVETPKKKDYPSLITLFFVLCFLAIDYSPIFNTTDVISVQFFELSILNVVIGLYFLIYKNALSESLASIFKKSILFKAYLIFILLCGISIFFAKNASLGIVFFTQLMITFISFINLSLLLYNRLQLIYTICFFIGLSALYQAYSGIKGVLTADSMSFGLLRLLGNTNSVNMFSASLSVKIPFIIIGIIHFSGWKKITLFISLGVVLTCMLLSGARAIYVALFLGLTTFSIFYFSKLCTIKKKLLFSLYIIIPIVCAVLVSNYIFKKAGQGDPRYTSVASRVTQIADSTGSGRIDLWSNALKMIKQSPIVGIGLGNYLVESIPFEREIMNNLDSSVHNHNDFLEITAETGILNGLIYLSIFVLVFFINVRKLIIEKDENIKLVALLSLLLLINYFIDAALNFPMYRPMQQVYFCFLIALTFINTSKVESVIPFKFKNIFIFLSIIVCSITVYISYYTFRAYQLENEIELDTSHTLGSKYILERLPKYPNVCISGEAFIRYVGMYFFLEKNYPEAKRYFNIAKNINPYTGVENWYLHKIERDNGNIDTAYALIKDCFYKRPRTDFFYIDATYLASQKKDPSEIIKIHTEYFKYIKTPESWANSAKALIGANYPPEKIVAFLDKGLAIFTGNVGLLEIKKQLENYDFNAYLTSASNYSASGQFDKALIWYKKALQENNTDKSVLVNIGICYFQLKNYREGILYFNKSLNYSGLDTGIVEYYLGISYLNIGDKANGCKFLTLANNKKYPGVDAILKSYCN